MAVKVMMPKGSDTMTEGKVLKWLKKEGDAISTGDTVVEIETDKVNMEVEAMGSGVLRKILVATRQSGARRRIAGGDWEGRRGHLGVGETQRRCCSGSSCPGRGGARQGNACACCPQALHAAVGGTSSRASLLPKREAACWLHPSPSAWQRKWAWRLPTLPEPAPMEGSFAKTWSAVRRVAPAPRAAAGGGVGVPTPARAPAPLLPRRPAPSPTGPEFSDEPLSSMRKVIATRLVQSKAPVPHFYLTIEVNMQRAKELRESANLLDPELKLSYNDIILKACAAALRQNPEVNASFQGESIRYHHRVHLGMAVATEGGGLITPVLRNADTKSLAEISSESKELAARARTRKLLPEEYAGSTFSISNLGMMGIDEFSAVINPPEGAILAVGAVAEKPVVVDGRVEAGLRCRLTLSCDHRVVDGATGAKFLQSLKQILENPVYLAF